MNKDCSVAILASVSRNWLEGREEPKGKRKSDIEPARMLALAQSHPAKMIGQAQPCDSGDRHPLSLLLKGVELSLKPAEQKHK